MVWLIREQVESLALQRPIAIEAGCQTYEDLLTAQRPQHLEATEYRKEYGFYPQGVHAGGKEIPDRFWPNEGHFIDGKEVLPVLLGVGGFYLISESWRDVIEEFEPGVHQFKHIPLFRKDGSPLEERFHALNIRQALTDAADRERSTAPSKTYKKGRFAFVNTTDHPKTRVYFFKEKVKRYHLWCPREILIYNIAMSDELFERISQLGGMETINALRIEEV